MILESKQQQNTAVHLGLETTRNEGRSLPEKTKGNSQTEVANGKTKPQSSDRTSTAVLLKPKGNGVL